MNRFIESLQLRSPNGALYENYQAARTLSKKYPLAPFDLSYRNARAEFFRGGLHKAHKPYDSNFYRIWDLNIEQENRDSLINDFYNIFLCDRRWLTEGQTVIDSNDYPLITRFENDGPYQRGNVRIEQGDFVIDAGANVGLFDILASFFNPAIIYAFEPTPQKYAQLNRTVSRNKICKNVHPIRAALSNKTETVPLTTNPSCDKASDFKRDHSFLAEDAKTYSLDEWIENNNIPKVDFIKADIGGTEGLLLDGAQKTLEEFKPKLAIRTSCSGHDKENLEHLIHDVHKDYVVEHYAGKLYAYAKNTKNII